MGIVDIAVMKPHKKICQHNRKDNHFEDMDTYLELARRSIVRFAPRYASYFTVRQMLNSDDVISNIATDIMIAQCEYKDGIGSKEPYLIGCAVFSIIKYMRRAKLNGRNKKIEFNKDTGV